jgi:hypothetical protein
VEPLVDTLIYLVIIGGAIAIVGILLFGIYRMTAKIRRINARMIWRTIARHRHV